MRHLWQSIHADLTRLIALHSSRRQYLDLQRSHPGLARFADPGAVLDFLHRRDADPDDKNRILAILVSASQRGDGKDAATTMVWLALWPGLDALYRRLWRHFRRDPAELVSEVAGRFAMEVHRADLGRIHRVAATLLANVERDIRDGLRRGWAEAALRREMPEPDDLGPDARPPSAFFDIPPGIDADAEADVIGRVLTSLVGGDAGIVIAVVVMGEGQSEIADRLGLSHDAVRKRYQRALHRLRDALKEK